ncbi:CHAP domain-containing protein [Lactococcus insecticola]|uniref:Peptidase C51 domain-containing protein n=1 Tax=Pseudolactococcus insecticola TaxID=2709158 RepID=A0A6A0B913_9LACT|nr:CHAP domain-containing protein [Lactococcus insecticola]GFH40804.1 hypothetical protein Hs20B_12020 [Lactococcus insecticola]
MKKYLLIGGLTLFMPVILFVTILFTISKNNDSASADAQTQTGGYYVKHWSGADAYTHNLLCQRYGITADQLDGFLATTGISYDKNRINGAKLLEWQKASGLDVRAIVAIAQMESSYGTAGVATQKGANMFGYGAFDNDPNNASNFNDEKAVVGLTTQTIIANKNETFKDQDDKAKALANGSWNPSMGGVYFTATNGTGQKRADVMTALDKWIDDHGGTPDPPCGYGAIGGVVGGGAIGILDQVAGQRIGSGQCYALTSYYAEKMGFGALSGGIAAADIGKDYNWAAKGWQVITDPKAMKMKTGDIINFKRGGLINYGSFGVTVDGTYGHTGVVGGVNADGSIVLYDQNPKPVSKTTVSFPMSSVASIIHPPAGTK